MKLPNEAFKSTRHFKKRIRGEFSYITVLLELISARDYYICFTILTEFKKHEVYGLVRYLFGSFFLIEQCECR